MNAVTMTLRLIRYFAVWAALTVLSLTVWIGLIALGMWLVGVLP